MAGLLSGGGGRGKGLTIKMYIYIYIYFLFYFIFLFCSCAIKKNILLKTKKYFISILTTQFFFVWIENKHFVNMNPLEQALEGGGKKLSKSVILLKTRRRFRRP